MSEPLRVFVNERLVRVAPGAKLLDAVAAFDPLVADAVEGGAAYLTDGRGIGLGADSAAFEGAIVRVIARTRAPRGEADAHA